jgi:hypothetical protein
MLASHARGAIVAEKGRIPMGDRAPQGNWSHHALMAWIAIAAIGMIVVLAALGVTPVIDPEQTLSIFAAP